MIPALKTRPSNITGKVPLAWLLVLVSLLVLGTVEKAEAAQDIPDKVVLPNFPIYAQWHTLSCEYAATRMITAFWNREMSEADFINAIPVNPNPHLGYRGNIDGWFGGTWDYGIYAEPIARVLNERGFKTKLLAGGQQALKNELAKGRPVQLWVIAGMGWGNPFTATSEGLPFKLAGGEHSVVAFGYDNDGVYIADPGYGTSDYYSWGTFLRSWSYFDYMAMAVWVDNGSSEGDTGGISPYFYRHWLNAGNLPIFGYPITDPQQDGSKVVQYFERARLEYDLNGPNTQPTGVGLLGRELTVKRQNEGPFRDTDPAPGALFFQETAHNLSGDFRTFWEANGGINNFGFPISEPFSENGKTVQYLERARFELVEPGKVQLGLLGIERINKPGTPAKLPRGFEAFQK